MITLKMGEDPELPDEFRCPICGDKLVIDIDEWISDYDGWKADESGVHVSCVSEPDFAGDDYADWLHGHYRMPYVDWLPVERKVYGWLEDNYRFTEMPYSKA